MTADALRRAMEISPGFRASVLLFAHVFTVQAGSTALANAKASIAERLSRWILMAQDRLESHNVPLTHEFLAIIIGTPRPGVTIALNDLKHRGLITTSRGLISVVDRSGLERASNGFYGGPEREFRRLFS